MNAQSFYKEFTCILEFVLFPAATASVEGKMNKTLKKLMKKVVASDAQEELAVADAKLGNVIKVIKCDYC